MRGEVQKGAKTLSQQKPQPTDDDRPTLGDAIFLGREAETLSSLIAEQVEAVFQRLGIVIPVKSCSLLSALAESEPASAADLARALDHSHQLVLQKIPALIKLGLIHRRRDPEDARRRVFRLTEEGVAQLARLQRLEPALEQAYLELYQELGVDLREALSRAAGGLRQRSLLERFPAAELVSADSPQES
jgi:DNA-binding MarR family transcriptional regulator